MFPVFSFYLPLIFIYPVDVSIIINLDVSFVSFLHRCFSYPLFLRCGFGLIQH